MPAPVSSPTILLFLFLVLYFLLLNFLLLALLRGFGHRPIASENPTLVLFQPSLHVKRTAARASRRSEPAIRVIVRVEALDR